MSESACVLHLCWPSKWQQGWEKGGKTNSCCVSSRGKVDSVRSPRAGNMFSFHLRRKNKPLCFCISEWQQFILMRKTKINSVIWLHGCSDLSPAFIDIYLAIGLIGLFWSELFMGCSWAFGSLSGVLPQVFIFSTISHGSSFPKWAIFGYFYHFELLLVY